MPKTGIVRLARWLRLSLIVVSTAAPAQDAKPAPTEVLDQWVGQRASVEIGGQDLFKSAVATPYELRSQDRTWNAIAGNVPLVLGVVKKSTYRDQKGVSHVAYVATACRSGGACTDPDRDGDRLIALEDLSDSSVPYRVIYTIPIPGGRRYCTYFAPYQSWSAGECYNAAGEPARSYTATTAVAEWTRARGVYRNLRDGFDYAKGLEEVRGREQAGRSPVAPSGTPPIVQARRCVSLDRITDTYTTRDHSSESVSVQAGYQCGPAPGFTRVRFWYRLGKKDTAGTCRATRETSLQKINFVMVPVDVDNLTSDLVIGDFDCLLSVDTWQPNNDPYPSSE